MADFGSRVVEELSDEPHPDTAKAEDSVFQTSQTEHSLIGDREEDYEEEFEFAFVTGRSPISADEIFSNGRFKPVYPVLCTGARVGDGSNPKPKRGGRVQLRKLMSEERETTTCSSSPDVGIVSSGTYCVWEPNELFTGSPKRWKLRNLLRRSSRAAATGRKRSSSVHLPGKRRQQR